MKKPGVANAGFLVSGLSGGLAEVATTVTADTTVKLHKVLGRALRVTRCEIINPTGLAQDASNYCNFKLIQGASTLIANWSTQTGQTGSLAANTPSDMTLTATTANLDVADTATMSLFIDVTGTVTVPPGRIVVEGYEL